MKKILMLVVALMAVGCAELDPRNEEARFFSNLQTLARNEEARFFSNLQTLVCTLPPLEASPRLESLFPDLFPRTPSLHTWARNGDVISDSRGNRWNALENEEYLLLTRMVADQVGAVAHFSILNRTTTGIDFYSGSMFHRKEVPGSPLDEGYNSFSSRGICEVLEQGK